MKIRSMSVSILALVLMQAACDSTRTAGPDPTLTGDAVTGRFAFVNACASCHASGDGLDLAAFRFSDTTIIRRAVKHVDTLTARNIVAYVHTLNTQSLTETTHLFQPGGTALSSDVDFAVALFGSDTWPSDMTTDKLRAINPRTVRIAVSLPIWSDEQSNLDWMPDIGLADGILDDSGGKVRDVLASYRASSTKENLLAVVTALRDADHRTTNPSAPCLLEPEDPVRVNYPACFQLRRWTASLIAQHMIRYGFTDTIDLTLSDVWWDVGNAARRSIKNGVSNIDNATRNWVAWMYLSWSFDPAQHPSEYNAGGLMNSGLPRHATFVSLRSAVARPAATNTPYFDIGVAVSFAPNAWVYNVASFGFRHLLDRLNAGDVPIASQRANARSSVNNALANARNRLAEPERTALTNLANQVLAKIPQ